MALSPILKSQCVEIYPKQIHVEPTPKLLFPPVLIEYVPLDTIDWEDAEITLTEQGQDADTEQHDPDIDRWETEGGAYCLSCGFTVGCCPMFGCLTPEVHKRDFPLGLFIDVRV